MDSRVGPFARDSERFVIRLLIGGIKKPPGLNGRLFALSSVAARRGGLLQQPLQQRGRITANSGGPRLRCT
jgi:hypothetical protein